MYAAIRALPAQDLRALEAMIFAAHGETLETLQEKVAAVREARGASS